MGKVCSFLSTALVLWLCGHPVFADVAGNPSTMIPQGALMQQLIDIVIQNNPLLSSQASVVESGSHVRVPHGLSSVTRMNLSGGIADNSTVPDQYHYGPTATLGFTFDFSDPGRALNILRITQEKEQAKQQWEKTKNDLISQLFQRIDDILRLESQQKSQSKLSSYLENYTALLEKQVAQGVVEPDRLLPLKERLATLEVDLQDTKNKLGTIKIHTAMSLAGDKWKEMLVLLDELRDFP